MILIFDLIMYLAFEMRVFQRLPNRVVGLLGEGIQVHPERA